MTQVKMPEPVAEICSDYDLHWAGSGAISPLCERTGAKVGSLLITTTQAEAYADARVAESQQWHPIETAPKDGTAILVSNERGAWFAKYEPVYQSGYRPENPWFSLMLNHDHMRTGKPYAPTHWMPLPAPPLSGPASHNPIGHMTISTTRRKP